MNIVSSKEERVQATKVDPERLADKTAEKVVELLGKTPPVRRIRNSQLLSLIFGAMGFSLFTIGVGKIFADLSGWTSLGIGLVMMAITGALLKNLER